MTAIIDLYRVTISLEMMQRMTELELSTPPRLAFRNSAVVSQDYERFILQDWSIEDSWVPSPEFRLTEPKIIAVDPEFSPDFFLLSYEFISSALRNILQDFDEHIKYFDIDDANSCLEFREKEFKLAVFPSLSPFQAVFADLAIDAAMAGEPLPKFEVREDFSPISPIFNVATGPWLMCTEDVVKKVMPHSVTGIVFTHHGTDEVFVPGSQ